MKHFHDVDDPMRTLSIGRVGTDAAFLDVDDSGPGALIVLSLSEVTRLRDALTNLIETERVE